MQKVIYKPGSRAREYAWLAANLFTGCPHGCGYCYVPGFFHIPREEFLKTAPRPGVLKVLEKDAALIACTNRRVMLCFGCDPYPLPPIGSEWRGEMATLTRKAIKILRKHSVPFMVLTKAGMAAALDFDLYRPCDMFGVSLTFIEPAHSEEWEPGAALPASRIEALRLAKSKGIFTFVSLEPVVSCVETLELIEQTHDFVDHFKLGRWNHSKDANTYNWRNFGIKAIERLEKFGASYFIKQDLAAHLDGVEFRNTETRTVDGGPPDDLKRCTAPVPRCRVRKEPLTEGQLFLKEEAESKGGEVKMDPDMPGHHDPDMCECTECKKSRGGD